MLQSHMTRWMFPYIACMSLVALGAGVLNTWRELCHSGCDAGPVERVHDHGRLAGSALVCRQLGRRAHLRHGSRCHGVAARCSWEPFGWALHRMRPGAADAIELLSGARAAWSQPVHTRRIVHLMGPALLGVSVSQISLLINTQIASHLATVGSVTWLNNASLLMEFPDCHAGCCFRCCIDAATCRREGQSGPCRPLFTA
jgi:putative peptidoglycan lipid II flippase